MSFFCSSFPSTSRSLVTNVAPRQVLSFLYPTDFVQNIRNRSRHRAFNQNSREMVSTSAGLESWFIISLASAGNCRKHTPSAIQSSSFFTPHRPHLLKRRRTHNVTLQRQQHTKRLQTDFSQSPVAEPN